MDATNSPLYLLDPTAPRLRVCVLLAAARLPAWLDETLAALIEAPFLDVHVLRIDAMPARRQGSLTWQAYQRMDRRLLGELAPILAMRPLRAAFEAAPKPADDAALRRAVAGLTPDVLLSIGRSPAPIELWTMARRTAWSMPAEACDPRFGLLHLLPAFLAGHTEAPSGLPVIDDRSGQGLLLDPAIVSIAQLSFARNTAYQLQKAPAKLLRALRRLQQGQPPTELPSGLPRPPGNLATVALCARLAARSARRHLPRLGRREHWRLAAARRAPPLDPAAASAEHFSVWATPPGWFWADPCPWSEDGRQHVFFEAYDHQRGIGEIHVVAVDDDGHPGPPEVAMRGPRHLSYPFLFTHGGAPHMLVECTQSQRIEAFRAESYPTRWTSAATLLDGWRAVDGTLVEHEGRWWLFACIAESPFDDGGREFNELFLFHAPGPLGPWTPHRANPVVTDVRRARPAGGLFRSGGRLVRPGQDCAAEYGHRIVFNEVLRLDPDHYEERALSTLEPDWAPGLHGCHTYAREGTLELLDAKLLVPTRDTRP